MTTARSTGDRRSAGEPDGRGPTGKARLDRAAIIAAGLDLAALPGATSISVRDLGARLGADPTAIYRHFRSKEHLMQALLDEVITRSLAKVTADPSDWRERILQLAQANLDLFVEYPAVGVEGVVLTTHGPGELAVIEFMLGAFSEAGLSGEDVVRHYALLASHMLSGAAGIARSRSQNDGAPSASSPWFEGPLLADPRVHPLIASFAVEIAELEDFDLYMLGVRAVIESAERTAAGS